MWFRTDNRMHQPNLALAIGYVLENSYFWVSGFFPLLSSSGFNEFGPKALCTSILNCTSRNVLPCQCLVTLWLLFLPGHTTTGLCNSRQFLHRKVRLNWLGCSACVPLEAIQGPDFWVELRLRKRCALTKG